MYRNNTSEINVRISKVSPILILTEIHPLKSDSHLPKKFIFICFNKIPLKMMKNTFYFTLKALFVLKYLNFCLEFISVISSDERDIT